jgi:hypothetical protein
MRDDEKRSHEDPQAGMSVDQRYKTGGQIHVGDRVAYNRQTGRVVFVVDRWEFADG